MSVETNIRTAIKGLPTREGAVVYKNTIYQRNKSIYEVEEDGNEIGLAINFRSDELEKHSFDRYLVSHMHMGIQTDQEGNWQSLLPVGQLLNGPMSDRQLRDKIHDTEGLIITVYRDKNNIYKLLYVPEKDKPSTVRLERVFAEFGGYIEDDRQEELKKEIKMPERFDAVGAMMNILMVEQPLENFHNATPLRLDYKIKQ